jgi:hypothetical protein
MSEETAAPTEAQVPADQESTKEPEAGADEWVREIGGLFGTYNQQIIQLTAHKAELEYSIGQVADTILRLCPELIARKADGVPESVCDCAARLITEYVELRKQFEPMAQRLQALEKEKEDGQGTVPAVEGSPAGDPGQGAPGDGAADQGLGDPRPAG